jgi:hypothetical protein
MPEIEFKEALNNAYKKIPIEQADFEKFKKEFSILLDGIRDNPNEREEHHKFRLANFLSKTWYDPDYYINTSGDYDLVIHNGNKTQSPIGVMIETKKPGKNPEMVSKTSLNVKSFQQLLLYFLRETIVNKNIHIKYLIITNVIEWFIFDAREFYNYFLKDKNLLRDYNNYRLDNLFSKDTQYFYEHIASVIIEKVKNVICYTHINLNDFIKSGDDRLVYLYKLLSPQHLLKRPFANDNNSLNKYFYFELLYILGLCEEKKNDKRVITRNPKDERQNYSLLESTIFQLSNDIDDEAIQYNIAFELVITWINRILFLKLLEAQLIAYQNGSNEYAFLNSDTINDYNELNTLFFKVLAREYSEREDDIKERFKNVPYLNSTLFDKTLAENYCIISTLKNGQMDIFSSTILKDENGNRRKGKINSLDYIFLFLDAYDFSNVDTELIIDKHKSIINASVLGLIFEKINGYKDGSYFTPGFVTSFICSEVINNAIISKFNTIKGWKAKNITDIYNKIDTIDILEANEIINSIKIIDPAVGSGHFLVSALNEIIAIKSKFGILADKKGQKIKNYIVSVINDELYISDYDNGKLFEYNYKIEEKQRVQETLFNEKRQIIENSLFGVDTNTNSVNICRLRLWIELLKHAYYTKESNYKELETLPNLELNIKCGNSLVSHFDIDMDISNIIKNLDFTIEEYKASVQKYKNTSDRIIKQDLSKKIISIKDSLKTEIWNLHKYQSQIRDIKGELITLTKQDEFFEYEDVKTKNTKRVLYLEGELIKLENKIKELEVSNLFRTAFEWRFEFPELLDNNGNFMGFDVVIGNPPYIRVQELDYDFIDYCKEIYYVAYKRVDISILFIELANKLLNQNGVNSYITSNQFLSTEYGRRARLFLLNKCNVQIMINFGDLPVFPEALTYVSIFLLKKGTTNQFLYSKVDFISDYIDENYISINTELLDDNPWSLSDVEHSTFVNKLKKEYPVLSSKAKCWAGLFTGKDDILMFDKKEINNIPFETDILLPVLRAQDCQRYSYAKPSKYVIYPYKEEDGKTVLLSEKELKSSYPNAYKYLLSKKDVLLTRKDSRRTVAEKKNWYGLIRFGKGSIFKQVKIISPGEVSNNKFSIDTSKSGFSCARVFAITTNNKSLDIYFLLGLLNSSLVEYFLHSVAPVKAGGYYQYSTEFINSVPLPKNLENKKNEIEQISGIVHDLLKKSNKMENTEIASLEKKINKLVYSLYELSKKEISLIESKGI